MEVYISLSPHATLQQTKQGICNMDKQKSWCISWAWRVRVTLQGNTYRSMVNIIWDVNIMYVNIVAHNNSLVPSVITKCQWFWSILISGVALQICQQQDPIESMRNYYTYLACSFNKMLMLWKLTLEMRSCWTCAYNWWTLFITIYVSCCMHYGLFIYL